MNVRRVLSCAALCLSLSGWAVLPTPAAAQLPLVVESRKIVPADGAAGDRFGAAVAVEGGSALVGALFADDRGDDAGSAYLVDAASGQIQRKLLANDRTREIFGFDDDLFGHDVDLQGSLALIGAVNSSQAGTLAGAVYVFDAVNGRRLAKLLPFSFFGDPSFQAFGFSTALSDQFIAVGAPGDVDRGSGAGALYLYRTSDRQRVAKVFAQDAGFADNLGYRVAVSGSTAVASAPFDDDGGTDAGAVYVFDAATGDQRLKLRADDASAQQFFGLSLAVDDGVVAVGAPFDDDSGQSAGAVYLMDAITGAQLRKLTAPNGQAGDQFGFSVALSSKFVLVGAPTADVAGDDAGTVYVFDRQSGALLAELRASDAATGDVFGNALDVSGGTVVVGALRDGDRGEQSGAAYLFEIAGLGGGGELASSARVSSITPTAVAAGFLRARAQVTVTVADNLGQPVAGAIVTLAVSGDITEVLSGSTGASGAVTLTSNQRSRVPVSFTACVVGVVAALPHVPSDDVETCDGV